MTYNVMRNLKPAVAVIGLSALVAISTPKAAEAGAVAAQATGAGVGISAPAARAGTAKVLQVGRRRFLPHRSLRRRLIFSSRYGHLRYYRRPRVYLYVRRPRRIYRPHVYHRARRYCIMRRDSCAFRFGYKTRSWYRCMRHYGC